MIDYFTIYKIPESIWVSSAAMHLEFSGAQWWKCYKLQHGMVGWQGFVAAVTRKFGANAYPRALRRLMSLRQTDSLDSHISEFEKVRYGVVVHNPKFDEIFFVTQFARGLKLEIQNVVQVQVPTTVDRAILLAQIQPEVLDRNKFKGQKQTTTAKFQGFPNKMENKGGYQASDLAKERQVREYRKLNGLCYACGDKFEPGHLAKCTKRNQIQLNAVV